MDTMVVVHGATAFAPAREFPPADLIRPDRFARWRRSHTGGPARAAATRSAASPTDLGVVVYDRPTATVAVCHNSRFAVVVRAGGRDEALSPAAGPARRWMATRTPVAR